MNSRWPLVWVLMAGSILSGCHEGEERDALEQVARHADMVLAEEQDLAANLPERRGEADKLLALRDTACPPADPAEVTRRLETLATPAEVRVDESLRYTVRGSGGPDEAGGALGRLSMNAGYLSLRHFELTNTTWMAQLVVGTRCPPPPERRLSAFPLPPKTDLLRSRPEQLRLQIAATEKRVRALERVLWDEPRVLTINALKKDVEGELTWDLGTEGIRGQVKLMMAVLRDGDPGRFVADFDGDSAHLEADAALDHAPATVEDLWQVRREVRCRQRWCASAEPNPHAAREQALYARTYRAVPSSGTARSAAQVAPASGR